MIAVVGEALIDAHYDGELLRPFPGAGPFNTAIALAHLGAPVCFVGAISPDRFGRLLEEALRSAGVETGTVVRVDASTPVAIVDLSSAEPAYSFYLADTGLEAFSSQDLPELPAEVGELHVGSLGLASDPPGAAVVELAEREASTNALVVDPNIRPVAIDDRGAYLRRFERLGGIADLVKLSVSDAGLALPGLERRRGGSPPARGRCRLRRAHAWLRRRGGMDRDRLDHGCRTPRDRRRHGRPGDAFGAGLLAWLWRAGASSRSLRDLGTTELQTALTYASAAAAAQCTRASAWGPTVADIEDLLGRPATVYPAKESDGVARVR